MLSFMKDEEGQDNGSQANTSSEGLSSNEETSKTAQTAGQATQPADQATQPADQTTQPADQTTQPADQTTQPAGQIAQAAGQTTEASSLNKPLSAAGDLEQAPTQDYLVPSSSGKKVKYSTMILGVVFLVGAASLFFVIKKFGPDEAKAGLSENDKKIAMAVIKLNNSKQTISKKMNDIVDRISRLSQVEQVSVDELKKNPFVQDTVFSGVDVGALNDDSGDSKYKLWSVMESGDQKSCMINDRVYTVGDRVGKYSVERIGEGFVELASGEKKLVLRMSK